MAKSKGDSKEKKSKKAKDHGKHKKHKREKDDRKRDTKRDPVMPFQTITKEDFFLKNEEFRVWCNLVAKKPFEDMTSDEARETFSSHFLKDYNRGKLGPMFYTGAIPPEVRELAMKSQHKWKISMSAADKETALAISDDVERVTRINTEGAWHSFNKGPPNLKPTQPRQQSQTSSSATTRPDVRSQQDMLTADEQRDARRLSSMQDRKRSKAATAEYLEEFVPKESGREAAIDKRRAVGHVLHGAARDREDDRDGLNVSEDFLMGGGEDFESVKARMRNRGGGRGAGAGERSRFSSTAGARSESRIKDLKEKEEQRSAHFMAQLGVDLSKGPIKIAPRQP